MRRLALVALLALLALPAPGQAAHAGVSVAVIDSGISPTHPEFSPGQVIRWKDYAGVGASPYDDHGHGTAVASRVAGKTLGAYPGVPLIVAKVLDANNSVSSWGPVVSAIRWATDEGADVINVSIWSQLPFPTGSTQVAAAIDYATSRGVLVVWIAGNGGVLVDPVPSPVLSTVLPGASSAQALVVGASTAGGTRASFSQRDPEVLAHGQAVRVAHRSGGSFLGDGTSFAAPWMAGVAARLLEDGAPRDPSWLKWVLLHSATDTAQIYLDEGYGVFDAAAFGRARAVAGGTAAVPGPDARDAFHLAFAAARVAQTARPPAGALPPG